MASTRIDYTAMDWASAVPFYGPAANHEGRDIVQLKVLSDRRRAGGGIAWLVRFTPPAGKLIKIVAQHSPTSTSSHCKAVAAPRPASVPRARAVTASTPKGSRTAP